MRIFATKVVTAVVVLGTLAAIATRSKPSTPPSPVVNCAPISAAGPVIAGVVNDGDCNIVQAGSDRKVSDSDPNFPLFILAL